MKHQTVKKIALELEEKWNVYQSEIDHASPLDRINNRWEIEKEFFENECFDLGLTDIETDQVMQQLGY